MENTKASAAEGFDPDVQAANAEELFALTVEPACRFLDAMLKDDEGNETNSQEVRSMIEDIIRLQEKQRNVEESFAAIESVMAAALNKGVLTREELEKMKAGESNDPPVKE